VSDEPQRVVLHEPEDEVGRLLRALQRLLLKYPVASQALFTALVAEGRLFGATEAGRAWRGRLAASPLIRRGRVVWDETTLRMLEEDPATVIPSAVVDAFVHAAMMDGLEPFLSRLFEEGVQGGADAARAG
jgi:hypothetical protein